MIEQIESRVFPVKCKGCFQIYDSIAHDRCPYCNEKSIIKRLEWSRDDFRIADGLIRGGN